MTTFLHDSDDGHTVAAMTETAMEGLGLFDGDTVSIKGKRGRRTMATVAMIMDGDAAALGSGKAADAGGGGGGGAIGLTQDAMKNAGVRAGDEVTVTPAPDVKFGKAALILPYSDSVELAGLSDLSEEELEEAMFEGYLKPYFAGKFRTLHRGDSFTVDGPSGLVEFQCVEIDSVEVDGDTACVVVDDTLLECDGEPVDRDDADDLADAGYDAIGGAASHLASVRELVELPLKHPELWTKLGINTPRGVLLTGPSGCGKTAMARAVAAETGAYFFVINGPEVISKRAGESETNLRRAFEDAEANAADYGGAIVFIDEIDSIAPRRDKAGGEVEKRIVSQLLTLMDGLKPASRVIVIAATNRPGVVEPALRRPGRFDRELDMGIPNEEGRLEILQIKTRDMRLGDDVDLGVLAQGTHGFVGADLQQLCMEAALECIRERQGLIDFDRDRVDKNVLDSIVVDMSHFEHAMGVVHPSSLRESAVSFLLEICSWQRGFPRSGCTLSNVFLIVNPVPRCLTCDWGITANFAHRSRSPTYTGRTSAVSRTSSASSTRRSSTPSSTPTSTSSSGCTRPRACSSTARPAAVRRSWPRPSRTSAVPTSSASRVPSS